MTEGQASEPPQGTPGRRALGAMESAVRRARESAGGASGPGPGRTGRARAVTRERWLVGSVVAAAVLVVVAAVALALTLSRNGSPSPSPPTAAAGGGPQTSPRAPSTTSTSPTSSAGSTASTTSTTVPATPGAAPVISALDPASGVAGQGIQIAGANFLSSSGQIVATFNGQVAPTTCPAQSTCTVTVPPGPRAGSVQVVVTTSAGSSNPATFTYS